MPRKEDPTLREECYFHIDNGGISISIKDVDEEYHQGPQIMVSASHFGTKTSRMLWTTNTESLRALGMAFLRGATAEYTPVRKDYNTLSCHSEPGEYSADFATDDESVQANLDKVRKHFEMLTKSATENVDTLEEELERAKSRLAEVSDPELLKEQESRVQDFGKSKSDGFAGVGPIGTMEKVKSMMNKKDSDGTEED